ncbi:MAG TPA: YCF48-related protein [Usitatibacter sp.]|nr:YCF48-related protein [Usitatibacter sp.]
MATRASFAATVALAALSLPVPAGPVSFEPEAVVHRVDRVAILALARAGDRVIAAGERGRILSSADDGVTWKVAATPTYQTLTSLSFSSATTGFATGHQGALLRTDDGGLTWNAVSLDGKDRPALFAVRVAGGRGIAVGAFGAYFETSDGGRTWSSRKVVGPDFDRHLTGIASIGPGRMIIAGEAGTLLSSSDDGATWHLLKSPYEGSFFGAIGITGGTAIAYGMRGNAWRSADGGQTWRRIDLGRYKGSLQGAAELPDGSVVLAGADGMVAMSRDGGATFTALPLGTRASLTAVLHVSGGWIVAGPAGLRSVH